MTTEERQLTLEQEMTLLEAAAFIREAREEIENRNEAGDE